MYSQFQLKNPARPVAWRRERVIDLLETLPEPAKPSRRYDDKYIREYYRFLQKYLTQETEAGRTSLFGINPALYYAHYIHFHPDKEWRSVLQAYLLTGEDDDAIAAAMDIMPEAVRWYSRLFYDVRDRLHVEVYIAKTVLGSAAYRAANRESTLTDNQQDMLFKLFGYYGGPLVLNIIISGYRRASIPRRQEEITPWFDSTFTTTIRSRSTQAARVFNINRFNVMELMQIHCSIMASERAAAQGGPETDVEQNVRAFMERIPWAMGKKEGKDLPAGSLEHKYATSSIEPRADDQMALALGYVPEPLTLAEEAHDPSRIVHVETDEE